MGMGLGWGASDGDGDGSRGERAALADRFGVASHLERKR